MSTLEALYGDACRTPSDINEHLPLLRMLASRCDHVTEFGTRWANGSTIAFLSAQPKQFVAWDLNPQFVVSQKILNLIGMAGRTRFQPRTGSTLEINIEPTDLLFIDTLHTYQQLKAELWRHGDPRHFHGKCDCLVKKYIVLHDTCTFGRIGEDGKEPGLVQAIREFHLQHTFPIWGVMALDQDLPGTDLVKGQPLQLENNNGLIVLEHAHS